MNPLVGLCIVCPSVLVNDIDKTGGATQKATATRFKDIRGNFEKYKSHFNEHCVAKFN